MTSVLVFLIITACSECFLHRMPNKCCNRKFLPRNENFESNPIYRKVTYLSDLISIGTPEAITIAVAALVLFGLPKLSFFNRGKLANEEDNSVFAPSKWREPYRKQLKLMTKLANDRRVTRSLQRLEQEVTIGNEEVIRKIAEFEKLQDNS